jgi:hypothetical protein
MCHPGVTALSSIHFMMTCGPCAIVELRGGALHSAPLEQSGMLEVDSADIERLRSVDV